MGDQSAIAWTDATWNPLVGCSRVSEGCRHCYAEREAYRLEHRLGQPKYAGTTKWMGQPDGTTGEPRWTGLVALWESVLDQPLCWKRPRRIFVNSMSDLFHERVPAEWIEKIFEVMRLAKQHTFQVLTKRPGKMHRLLTGQWPHDMRDGDAAAASRLLRMQPLPNVWLGVSVEDQATADERIPLLLQTPAAVRWVSYEPALGPVDFTAIRYVDELAECRWGVLGREHWVENSDSPSAYENDVPGLDWIVIGGESGQGARPFDLAWARQTVAQGRAAGVPVFVKQLGAVPYEMREKIGNVSGTPFSEGERLRLVDRKGGDPAEWPEDLRVREYPKGVSP